MWAEISVTCDDKALKEFIEAEGFEIHHIDHGIADPMVSGHVVQGEPEALVALFDKILKTFPMKPADFGFIAELRIYYQ